MAIKKGEPPLIDNGIFDAVCKEVLKEQDQRYKDWINVSSKKA